MTRISIRKALFAAGLLFAACAGAQPGAPIRLIVPSPAGGAADGLARMISVPLREMTGVTVLVENKPGASTTIGMRDCYASRPDGKTFCITLADSLSYNPHVFSALPYDASKFIGVAHLGYSNGMILAHASAPFSTYQEMIAVAKDPRSRVLWATYGDASLPDLLLRWSNYKSGSDITAIPYKGGAPANNALVSGEVQVGYMGIGTSKPHLLKGSVKPLAMTGKARSPLFPDVPTLQELGMSPGLSTYFGLYAPPGTPDDIVLTMHGHIQKILDTPAAKQHFETYTRDRSDMSQKEFDQFIHEDRKRAGDVFRALGSKPSAIKD